MPDNRTIQQFTLGNVSHGQFYLEPLARNIDLDYVDDDAFANQHFTAFPQQVAFFTPRDVNECDMVVELGSAVPPLDEAEQVVSVPLNVEDSEGLYLRTAEDDGDFYRLDIPPGQYDVVARIYPTKNSREGDSNNAFLPHCQVALTFLPAGTLGPRVLKVAFGALPERLTLRGDDGSAIVVQNNPALSD